MSIEIININWSQASWNDLTILTSLLKLMLLKFNKYNSISNQNYGIETNLWKDLILNKIYYNKIVLRQEIQNHIIRRI